MLSSKDKRTLKSLAQKIDNRYLIGKNEINESLIDMLSKALVAHELIKISLLKTVDKPLMSVAIELSNALNAEIVQTIGRVIVLFKRNKENPKISLK